MSSIVQLRCALQTYDWGSLGEHSLAGRLALTGNPDLSIDPRKPYAELWMGTHPNGPSKIVESDESLKSFVTKNPSCLGKNIHSMMDVSGCGLPFLFKVLSIRKPLSIQAHPTKEHAAVLHEKYPEMYKDPNHKPEIALALSPFEALCGFRPIDEIIKFLQIIPELGALLGKNKINELISKKNPTSLKSCFSTLMHSSADVIEKSVRNLISRLASCSEEERCSQLASLIERLDSEFPNDVGVFGPYFFNVLNLKPGESIFLAPNIPHAYLKGDCVECMACSDNVVRAGLTPKFKDVDTLCEMLDYNGKFADEFIFKPDVADQYSVVFNPPVPEFQVTKIEIVPELYRLCSGHSVPS